MFCILQAHKPELNRCAYAQHNEQCWVCKDYQAGKTKPAYPVPAIRTHMQILKGCILMWDLHRFEWTSYPTVQS